MRLDKVSIINKRFSRYKEIIKKLADESFYGKIACLKVLADSVNFFNLTI